MFYVPFCKINDSTINSVSHFTADLPFRMTRKLVTQYSYSVD